VAKLPYEGWGLEIKTMNLDEMLMLKAKLDPAPKFPAWRFVACIVAMVCAAVMEELGVRKLISTPFIWIPSLLLFAALTKVFVWRMRWYRLYDAMHVKTERMPWNFQERAMALYGSDWELAAIECHESHIPGDCPLCGAA